MKYKAIIETDDIKNFEFFEDGIGKYMVGKDAGAAQDGWMPLYFTEVKEEHENGNVLDKIRTEIEQNAYPIVYGVNSHEKGMSLYGILQILDKYKAESEGR
jgi:hypothetical protein